MSYKVDYELLLRQEADFLESEPYYVPFLSNMSALLYDTLPEVNWAGFYLLLDPKKLVLGPFQGKTACIHIPVGRGVCGTAVAEQKTMRVAKVLEFPGHIACDSASRSEIVVPLVDCHGEIHGVLDIDSALEDRFDEEDQKNLEEFCRILMDGIVWER